MTAPTMGVIRAMNRFERAVRDHENRYSATLLKQVEIVAEYEAAKKVLRGYVRGLGR